MTTNTHQYLTLTIHHLIPSLCDVLLLPDTVDWNDDVLEAYQAISQAFDYASDMLKNEDQSDSFIQFDVWSKTIRSSFNSLIEGFEESGLDDDWIASLREGINQLADALENAYEVAKNLYVASLHVNCLLLIN